MPYVTKDRPIRRAAVAWRGFGREADTPEARARYAARAAYMLDAWEASVQTFELTQQSQFACQVLQTWLAGGAVTLPAWPTSPEQLALLAQARAWLIDLPPATLAELFPGLTPALLAQARRALLPGVNLRGLARARVTAELAQLDATALRLTQLQGELEASLDWTQQLLKQFQTYATWFQKHLERKAEKTKVISNALSVISTVLNFVPVVGWALALIVEAVNVGIQLDALRDSLKAMEAAGGRIQAGVTYVALMEQLATGYAELQAAQQDVDAARSIREAELALLKRLGGAASGAVVVAPRPAGAAPPDALIAAAFGPAGRGRLVAGLALVAVAAWAASR